MHAWSVEVVRGTRSLATRAVLREALDELDVLYDALMKIEQVAAPDR